MGYLPIKMVITFLKALMTHMKTAFNFGNRLIVLSGRKTRKTRRDLMTPRSTWFESSRVLQVMNC